MDAQTAAQVAATQAAVPSPLTCIAFEGTRRLAEGPLPQVAAAARAAMERGDHGPIQVLDAETSEPVEIDFRGSIADVVARLAASAPEPARARPGRPRLGVVAREVTLLPRHWEWLAAQPGGASVALRKLVEAARSSTGSADARRLAAERCYRFMHAVGGNLPDFDEAARGLFAADRAWFTASTAAWPEDVRDHAARLAERVFAVAG
jgi:hypothetical protein